MSRRRVLADDAWTLSVEDELRAGVDLTVYRSGLALLSARSASRRADGPAWMRNRAVADLRRARDLEAEHRRLFPDDQTSAIMTLGNSPRNLRPVHIPSEVATGGGSDDPPEDPRHPLGRARDTDADLSAQFPDGPPSGAA